MEDNSSQTATLGGVTKRFFNRLLSVGENRFQLFLVEVQEERDRLIDIIVLAIAAAMLGMLAIIAWTAALVFLLWPYGHISTLIIIGALYGMGALALGLKLVSRRSQQQALAATMDQLRKDRECLTGN
jgi:uncharacterized membrane protein YqjE